VWWRAGGGVPTGAGGSTAAGGGGWRRGAQPASIYLRPAGSPSTRHVHQIYAVRVSGNWEQYSCVAGRMACTTQQSTVELNLKQSATAPNPHRPYNQCLPVSCVMPCYRG